MNSESERRGRFSAPMSVREASRPGMPAPPGAFFRALLENAADGVQVIDAAGLTRYATPSVQGLLGYPLESLLGRPLLELVHGEDADAARQALLPQSAAPDTDRVVQLRLQHRDGSWVDVEATVRDLLGDPAVAGRVITWRDITAHKRIEAELVHNAFHDSLTGLPNRALFMDRLSQTLRRAARDAQGGCAVLFLDLDRFKLVNDSMGHLIGDELLSAVAQRLVRCLRPGDTAARFAGDEFVVLLNGTQDAADATRVAERIRRELTKPFRLRGHDVFTHASIGIALGGETSEPDELLRNADVALYRAKNRRRGDYQLFDETLHQHALSLLRVETELARALERCDLRVFYQPVVSLRTGAVFGFEALVRWKHPERGLVLPAEFIPLVQESALILAIDAWVLHEACRQLHDWTQRFGPPAFQVSVNLSAKQFTHPNLLDQLERTLRDTGVQPSNLKLEVTERMLAEGGGVSGAMLRELQSMEVGLQIDGFGIGMVSLRALHRAPVDALKMDRSLVQQNGTDGALLRAVVAVAHSLNKSVVAAGMERPDQLAPLRELNCDYGQGFLFSEPIDGSTAEQLIADRRRW